MSTPGAENTVDQQQGRQERDAAQDRQQQGQPTNDLLPRTEVEKARRDAAKYRVKYRKLLQAIGEGADVETLLDDEEGDEETAMLRELKALRDEKATWERERRTTATTTALKDALVEAGAESKKIALLMRAVDIDRVKYDARGQPTNIADLVNEVKEAHGDLFRPKGKADAAEGGLGASGGMTMNDLIRTAWGGR